MCIFVENVCAVDVCLKIFIHSMYGRRRRGFGANSKVGSSLRRNRCMCLCASMHSCTWMPMYVSI